jgi:multidrug resistance efflux pump
MNKYFLIILLIAVFSCKSKDNNTAIKPKSTSITESVYASVTIVPENSYHVQPLRSGIIEKIYIEEGDLIKKGDILFEITASLGDQAQLKDAQINYQEAKSNYKGQNNLLGNIKLEIEAAQEQFSLDSINLKRQERLLGQNIGNQLDYDKMKLRYENSKKQLELLNQKLKQTRVTLSNKYKKAVNQIANKESQLADFKIHSKMDGKIYSVNKEVGDFVSSQEKLSEIGSHQQYKIVMDIDEVDITKINIGDSVLIVLDAYPKDVFVATVSKIYTKKNNLTQTFRVESTFKVLPPKLYYGLAGEANIIISIKKEALVIPAEYLLPNNKVMTDEGEVEVVVGMKNLEFVEIISGIDTSRNIIKPKE